MTARRTKGASPRRQITIIVFAREPVPGRTKTRLIPKLGANAAASMADAFLRDALHKAREIGRGRIIIAADTRGGTRNSLYFRKLARRFGALVVDQGDGSLGARMARALEPYSCDPAILIGSDCPSIPARLLSRSVRLLSRTPVVLGPSLDGGYYLIGVRGGLPDIFRGIRWGGGDVLARTIQRLRSKRVAYALGPAWYDVDRFNDVALLVAHLETRLRSGRSDPCPETTRTLMRLGLLKVRR